MAIERQPSIGRISQAAASAGRLLREKKSRMCLGRRSTDQESLNDKATPATMHVIQEGAVKIDRAQGQIKKGSILG